MTGEKLPQAAEVSGPSGSGPAPGKGPQPQYLRLPLDSARKLRWYDREDLSRLIESNLQERQQLAEVNASLREVRSDDSPQTVYGECAWILALRHCNVC